MTRQRRLLLEELRGRRDHPRAEELHRRLREQLPSISLATVYRNLEVLEEQGLLRVLEMPAEPRRYDAAVEEHHHLRCRNCGGVEDLPLEAEEELLRRARAAARGRVEAARMHFVGLCSSCAAAGGARDRESRDPGRGASG